MALTQSGGARHGEARLAGFIYAIVVIAGTFSLGYAPGLVFAGATPAEIAQSAAANEPLLRLLIAGELVCYTAFLVLPLALYRLLAPAGQFAASVMAALAMMSVPFGFANVMHLFDILRAIDAGGGAEIIPAAYERHRAGLLVQSIAWGGWLLPFGWLVIRSGFLPRLLGLILIAAGIGYLVHFTGRLLFNEAYEASGLAPILRAPRVGEIAICVWLLVMGARRRPLW